MRLYSTRFFGLDHGIGHPSYLNARFTRLLAVALAAHITDGYYIKVFFRSSAKVTL